MPDVEKILRLVAEGALTAEEADEILAALAHETASRSPASEQSQAAPRLLRIEVHEAGRPVVNLRVPLNVAGLAGAFVPGLSDTDSRRIQAAIQAGLRGPIVDIATNDGDRVLIVTE